MQFRKHFCHYRSRGGSSFLGQMFRQNPEAFYWFEPLHGVVRVSGRPNGSVNIENVYCKDPDGVIRLVYNYVCMNTQGVTTYRYMCTEEITQHDQGSTHVLVIHRSEHILEVHRCEHILGIQR